MLAAEDAVAVLGGEGGAVGKVLVDYVGPVAACAGDEVEESGVLWGGVGLSWFVVGSEKGIGSVLVCLGGVFFSLFLLTSSAVQGLLSMRGSRQSYHRFQHWSPFRVPTASAILLQRAPYSSTASRSFSSSSRIHVPLRMLLAML